MTAHEFLVELFNTAPELMALVFIWGALTFLVGVSQFVAFLFFAIPELFTRRECIFLDRNADGSYSLRTENIRPAFYRGERVFLKKPRGKPDA